MKIAALTTGFAILASAFLSGCTFSSISASTVSLMGNDKEATVKKTVKISEFNEIEASQGIKVIFVQGANKGVAQIATTPSAEKYLKVEVKNKTLKAYYSNSGADYNAKIYGPSIIRVSSPKLSEVDLSSSASVTIEGDLKSNGEFEIDLSSSASFNAGNISCRKLSADLSSSGSANIGNIIGDVDLEAASSSSFNAQKITGNLDIEAASCASVDISSLNGSLDVEASSIATVKIDALTSSFISADASSTSEITLKKISGGTIKAEASSSAKIKLSGKARSLDKEQSSLGTVDHKNLTLTR